LRDVAFDGRVPGHEPELAGDEHELADTDRLVVGRSLKGRRCCLGADHGLVHAVSLVQSRTTVNACASAAPSALKMASTTCSLSWPSTSRTWIVSPAASASASRNRPARSD